MQQLNFYTQLLKAEEEINATRAEQLDEEINILIHKLKFISTEARPSVLVLQQENGFAPLFNAQLVDALAIAGGKALEDKMDDPAVICVVQADDALYSEITSLLEDPILSRSAALKNNKLYIIQKSDFAQNPANFLADVEICAEIAQPKYFVYGREDSDWIKFDIA